MKQPDIRATSRDGKHVMITLGARAVGLEHARKQVKVLKRAETSIQLRALRYRSTDTTVASAARRLKTRLPIKASKASGSNEF